MIILHKHYSSFQPPKLIKHQILKYKYTFQGNVYLLDDCEYLVDLLTSVNDKSQDLKLYTDVKCFLDDSNLRIDTKF